MLKLNAANALKKITQTYHEYTFEILQATCKVTNQTAREESEAIAADAPERSKSQYSYANGEVVKKATVKEHKLSHIEAIIYNKNKPRLGHLLEYGHDIVRNGIVIGHAKAYPHIKTNEEKFNEIYVQRIVEAIRNHGGQI